MDFNYTSLSLGSVSVHRTIEPNTVSAYASIHADIHQFTDPAAVIEQATKADMMGRGDEEVLAAEISAAITYFDPMKAADISSDQMASSIVNSLNDQINFDVRVCGIAGATLPLLGRLQAPHRDVEICGLAVIEGIGTAPGFDPMDALGAGLNQIALLNAASSHSILWIQSVRDMALTQSDLYDAMAKQFSFKKKYPQWSVTTFSDVGPLSGTIAGIIPGRARWGAEDDWCKIGCTHEVCPSYAA